MPRPAASGTSTAPPGGALTTILCNSELSIKGISAGTTRVLSAPRSLQTAVAISMALVSPELSCATTSKLKRAANSRLVACSDAAPLSGSASFQNARKSW